MEKATFWQQKIIGICYFELVLLLFFYMVSASGYYMTIQLAHGSASTINMMVDYSLKAIFTYPIWWLFFKKWKNRPIQKKVWWHLLFLPLFVIIWQQTFYLVLEILGYWHMTGQGIWWDIYIPSMFYLIQFGIFHIYDYYHQLREKELQAAALRELALKNELTALKAQLNPHFLYNTFNTISASVPPEQEYTRELIAKLADLFRFQLKATKIDRVPLYEEITFLKKYLELEKARYGSRLKVNFNITPEVKNAAIPPILLQPLVENAIKHGISPKIEGGEVNIKITLDNQYVHFYIADTGVGLDEKVISSAKGLGLNNTRKRLEKIYQERLSIVNQQSGGVLVHFKIPFQLSKKETPPIRKVA